MPQNIQIIKTEIRQCKDNLNNFYAECNYTVDGIKWKNTSLYKKSEQMIPTKKQYEKYIIEHHLKEFGG